MTTKASHRLTLRDRLSRLNFTQACKLLGEEGRQLIQRGGKYEIDLDEQVYLEGDLFRVKFADAVVTITLLAEARDRLHWNCTACQWPCEHAGAAFSLLLEEKTALGLATPPPERIPVESLSEDELIRRAGGTRRAITKGKVQTSVAGSSTTLDRLHDHQRRVRQNVPCRPAGPRARHFLLFVPRFSHQFAGHLQTHLVYAAARNEEVCPGCAATPLPPQALECPPYLRRPIGTAIRGARQTR